MNSVRRLSCSLSEYLLLLMWLQIDKVMQMDSVFATSRLPPFGHLQLLQHKCAWEDEKRVKSLWLYVFFFKGPFQQFLYNCNVCRIKAERFYKSPNWGWDRSFWLGGCGSGGRAGSISKLFNLQYKAKNREATCPHSGEVWNKQSID